jgi:hypothetical protein
VGQVANLRRIGNPPAGSWRAAEVPGWKCNSMADRGDAGGARGVQYAFANWSDGGSASHAITIPATATTYAANFNPQYLLTTAGNPPAGALWSRERLV